MRFKKRPMVVYAVQFTGDNVNEVHQFTGAKSVRPIYNGKQLYAAYLTLYLDGYCLTVTPGDWVLSENGGDWYTHSDKTFAKRFEPDMEQP